MHTWMAKLNDNCIFISAREKIDMLQFLRIVAPRHDVEVCPYRGQSVGMGFVQVLAPNITPMTINMCSYPNFAAKIVKYSK